MTKIYAAVLSTFIFILAACGDDVTKVTQVTQESSGLEVVASSDSLGKCTEERSGEMKFASKENAVFVCADSAWKNVSGAGKDGTSCTVKPLPDSSGYKVVCDGDSIGVILNGKDGLDGKSGGDGKDGAGCSLAEGKDFISIACGEDTATIHFATCGQEIYNPAKTFCDFRDNHTYRKTTIGNQTWMAENLDYADSTTTQSLLGKSWCYDNSAVFCKTYGRLYAWEAAVESICPEGWHLPDTTEWQNLFTAIGGMDSAGLKLKSSNGWFGNGNGDGSTEFSALPAGGRFDDGFFSDEWGSALFWAASESGNVAYGIYLGYLEKAARFFKNEKDYAFSVRCVKD